MNVQLDRETEALVRAKVASGRYGGDADVIRAALRALDDRERLERLRVLVADGFAPAERGELIELTDEHMDELSREADEMVRLGKQPNPDVCP